MPVAVTLTWYEMALAAEVGTRRHIEALRAGLQDRHGAARVDGFAGWLRHAEGAAGELAVAKVLGVYWSGSVNTFHNGDGDVGRLHVRTRSRHEYELLVRDGDDDDAVYVLVTGHAPDMRVVGWLHGRDAKRDEYRQDHGGHGAAYFVPHEQLHPIMPLVRR